ncbi:MAG: antitoxin family protein [Blastocatellia bacterium]|nr:antitoxin family protein [Blastocatellia bacterium]
MDQKVTAIYENGVLRPTTPLALPERSHIEITLHHVLPSTNQSARSELIRKALIAAGLSLPNSARESGATPSPILSPEQREELARRFSAAKPLSKLISEDREGR